MPALLYVTRALRPVITVMESLAKALVRLFGVEPKDEIASAFTAEEVEHILAESHHEGLIEEGQHGLVGAALEFSDKDAVDVAVALADLVTLPLTATPDDVERLVAKRGFSRYPLVDRSGALAGYLHLKDVLYADDSERALAGARSSGCASSRRSRRPTRSRRCCARCSAPARTWPGSSTREGAAIGVVFLEDVIEELVGEVTDASQR